MITMRLDGTLIDGWPAFHRESRRTFGFPDFYGNNMDAWIDCLSTLRDPDDAGMTGFRLQPDETARIEVVNSAALRRRHPDIVEALEDGVAFCNDNYREVGEPPALELIFL